jgi:hypothetical protein
MEEIFIELVLPFLIIVIAKFIKKLKKCKDEPKVVLSWEFGIFIKVKFNPK